MKKVKSPFTIFLILALFWSQCHSEIIEIDLKTANNDERYYTVFEFEFEGGQHLPMTPSFAFQSLLLANSESYPDFGFNCHDGGCIEDSEESFTTFFNGEQIEVTPASVFFQIEDDGVNYEFEEIPVILTDKMPESWVQTNIMGIGADNYFMHAAAENDNYGEDAFSVFINMNSYTDFDFSVIVLGTIDTNYLRSKNDQLVSLALAESPEPQSAIQSNKATYFSLSEVAIGNNTFTTSYPLITVTLADRNLCVPEQEYTGFLSALCPKGCDQQSSLENVTLKLIASDEKQGFVKLVIDPFHYFDQKTNETLIIDSKHCMDVDDNAWGLGLVPASRFFWAFNGTSSSIQVAPSICFDGPRSFLLVYLVVSAIAFVGLVGVILGILKIFADEKRKTEETKEKEAAEEVEEGNENHENGYQTYKE